MYLTRFNPFNDIREIENRIFDGLAKYNRKSEDIAAFTPKVNTREGEFAFHIDIDLPGVKKEDIKVDVKDGNLIVSGERNFKEEIKEEDYYRVETNFGKFSRIFSLPDHTDLENITASSDNGVLEITVPKLQEVDSIKSIEIK